jgi:aromatic-L-amino-acid decarboxylase
MKWFRQMLDLPEYFTGVIQDTASVATLCALLVARERSLPSANKRGMKDHTLRVYCSSEAHSSVEKAVRIAGFGSDNLVKIPVDRDLRMQAFELRNAIATDILNGFTPTCIVAALGTTGTCSIDPIGEIAEIAKINSIWLHVDAAFAGTAMILPEFRSGISGIDKIDSFVFNPHKWMFTNFDCSVFFVRDKQLLEDTFRLVPDYLKSEADAAVNDFSNYGIQLGRRFRALKLWFVIRYYGIEGLRRKIRKHIDLAEWFENEISKHPDFELVTPRTLAVICFRYRPVSLRNEVLVNNLNETLLARINKTGKVFLSHTIVDGKFALRMVSAQTEVEMRHMEKALEVLLAEAAQLKKL